MDTPSPSGSPKGLDETLGMTFFPSEPGTALAEMTVTAAVCQPFGFLSGGASLALAETLAGRGSRILCSEDEIPLGIQVSGNHVHAVPLGGRVHAEARLLSRSRSLHVWNVDIFDENDRLVSTSRVTNRITKRKPA